MCVWDICLLTQPYGRFCIQGRIVDRKYWCACSCSLVPSVFPAPATTSDVFTRYVNHATWRQRVAVKNERKNNNKGMKKEIMLYEYNLHPPSQGSVWVLGEWRSWKRYSLVPVLGSWWREPRSERSSLPGSADKTGTSVKVQSHYSVNIAYIQL